MDTDDIAPPPETKPGFAQRDLTPLGINELEAYIACLEDEITRAEAAIDAKASQRSAAEAFFRK